MSTEHSLTQWNYECAACLMCSQGCDSILITRATVNKALLHALHLTFNSKLRTIAWQKSIRRQTIQRTAGLWPRDNALGPCIHSSITIIRLYANEGPKNFSR